MSKTQFTPEKLGEGWEFHHEDGMRMSVDDITASRGQLYAFTRLWWENGSGNVRVLSSGRRDLYGPKAVASILSDIKLAGPRFANDSDREWSWHELLTDAVEYVRNKHREGKDTVDLSRIGDSEFRWLLRPFVETGGHTRLIAAGGSRKSYLALAVALAVATGSSDVLGTAPTVTGPVLYLDWETNDLGRTHAYRLRAVARGAEVEIPKGMIHHQQHDMPLVERAASVAKAVDREGHELVIIDSNTMARGSGGRGGAEAATTDFLQALRIINRPALIIDHKSKEDMAKGRKGGYGFIHNENQVRLQWEYTRAFEQGSSDIVRVRLENTKQNNVAKQADVGFEIRFDNDRSDPDRPRLRAVTFEPIGPDLVRGVHPGAPAEEAATSTADRAVEWLAVNGAGTAREIADVLGVHRTAVSKAMNADGRFRKVGSQGPAHVWGLTDDEQGRLGVSPVTGEKTEVPW